MSTARRTYRRGRTLVSMRDEVAAKDYVYHADHQGTTQSLTDQTTGVVTDTFASDAWGMQVKRTGTSTNPQWYLARFGYYIRARHDYYVRDRWLSTMNGRWISRDGFIAGLRDYLYVLNNPVRFVDPSGRDARNQCPEGINPACSADCGACDKCDNLLGLPAGCKVAKCGEPGCSRKDAQAQYRALLDRLADLVQTLPGACSRQQPVDNGATPWAVTKCCAGDDGGETGCLDCPGKGGFYSQQPSCIQRCLLKHEGRHVKQCKDGPNLHDKMVGCECEPYRVECRCIVSSIAFAFVPPPAQQVISDILTNCCGLNPSFDDCKKSLSKLGSPPGT